MKHNPKMDYTYIGVDSHLNSHTAVVLDCFYDKLGEMTIGSAPSSFASFLKQVQKYCLEGTKPVFGFEDTTAYGRSLVKFLVKKGYLVKHCDAALVATERKSQNVLHKTDSVDAECCARVLLSRFDKLPIANPQDEYWILSHLIVRRNFLGKMKHTLIRQLHTSIATNYPSYKTFFFHIDTNTALTFYETFPSPKTLEHVSLDELTKFIKTLSYGNLGETKAQHILDTIVADGVTPSEYQDVCDFNIRSIIKQLKGILLEIIDIEKQIEAFLVHFDYPLTQVKGIDTLTCARLIVEIGNIDRFKNAKALARYSGVAPVTYSSGMSNMQYANERGNRTLHAIFYRIALTSIMPVGSKKALLNPLFYDYYQKKIAEGKTKKQAIKCVQRRLVNIIFNIMKHKTVYINPELSYVDERTTDNEAS